MWTGDQEQSVSPSGFLQFGFTICVSYDNRLISALDSFPLDRWTTIALSEILLIKSY